MKQSTTVMEKVKVGVIILLMVLVMEAHTPDRILVTMDLTTG